MGKSTKTLNKEPKETPVIFIDQLEVGKDVHIKVMICRRWDVNTIYGKYMSTDFIVSDQRDGLASSEGVQARMDGIMFQESEGSLLADPIVTLLKDCLSSL